MAQRNTSVALGVTSSGADQALLARRNGGFVIFIFSGGKFFGAADAHNRGSSVQDGGGRVLDVVEREIEVALRGLDCDARGLARMDGEKHAHGMEPDFRRITGAHFGVVNIGVRRDFVTARGALPGSGTAHRVARGEVASFGGFERASGNARCSVPAFHFGCFLT
jgi:hypothetical protein